MRFVQLRISNIVVTLLYAGFFPVWFFLTLYVQEVLHYDAIEAGVGMVQVPQTADVSDVARATLAVATDASAIADVGEDW